MAVSKWRNANYLKKTEAPKFKEKLAVLKAQTEILQLTTFKTHTGLLVAQALIAECERNYSEAMKQYEALLEHWEKSPSKIHEDTFFIRKILGNYLVCAFYCERLDVFPPVINRIKGLPTPTVSEEIDSFRQLGTLRMVYLLNTSNKTESNEVINEVETGLKKFNGQVDLPWVVRFRLNCCIFYVQQKKYMQLYDTVQHLYQIIQRNKHFEEELFAVKFYELIALYGLKNEELLMYQLSNTERWLRNNKLQNDYTKQLLKSFHLLIKGESREKVSGQLTEVNCPPENEMMKEIMNLWLT